MNKIIITAIALVLISATAKAETKLHVGSYHLTNREKLERENSKNEINIGIGETFGDWEVGFYRNSMYKWSAYGYYNYKLTDYFSVFGGIVSGYNYPVIPMVGIAAHIKNYQIMLLPGFTSDGKFVPTLGFSLTF